MGGNGSKARNVSFGLDEDEKVTVVEGVKLSEDVLRRMREPKGSERVRSPSSASESHKASPKAKPAEPSASGAQEEMRKNYERQQALVQEQLAKLAQRERETTAATDVEETRPSVIMEKWRTHEEQEKAKLLPADLDAWAKKLEQKEKELATISSFYKEQLEILEKKSFENYKQTSEQYFEAATKTEALIRPRHSESLCTDLQAKVLECYRENPQQTLHCSSLAKQYMNCVQQAKQSSLKNHG
ncbi:PREDICTED: MICOS complex subunit mic25-a-like isoform X1 [Cyprinodon variegatus]|uniref:MICOS complex subunit mic25-a-like isoform X1 n=1 Tax=Cyprinodon variegatus TaxID=28743 RepID=UPI0007429BB8|nr:PREDICTED: MICOS complex subunit mic25-a-like isoform X1 [Cyprinodon variegatus]